MGLWVKTARREIKGMVLVCGLNYDGRRGKSKVRNLMRRFAVYEC